MPAVVYAFGARSKSPRPWQNHELSELYRVVELLGKAGLAVETDMGLSDEGEPWFVFCRADNGDVVVHFARIDGQYVAASSVVDQSYRGSDFRDIIEQLVRQQPLVMPKASTGTPLFLHPAVVLTAFVATALFYSHRADAAETSGDSIAVSLGNGQHAHTDLLLRLLTAASPQHIDKVGARTQALSDGGTQLASLMAIAIATIVPLIDQSVELSLPPAPAIAADHPSAIVVDTPLDGRSSADTAENALHHLANSVFNLTATDSVTLGNSPLVPTHTVTTSATSIPVSVMTSDSVPVGRVTAHESSSAGATDHASFHVAARQTLIQLSDNASNNGTTGTPQTGGDTGHHISLSDLDPAAIQFFSLFRDTNTHNQTKTSTVGGGTQAVSDPASPGTPGTSEPLPSSSGTVATNIQASSLNQSDWVALFNEFSFSGQHALNGTIHPSEYLASVLPNYLKIGGGTIQLIVYDDAHAVSSSVFSLTKDVIFVQDKELGGTIQSLHGTNMVNLTLVNGDVMTLIGVITVDATHPLMG